MRAPLLFALALGTGCSASASTPSSPCPVEHASLGPGLTVESWPLLENACIDVVRADLAHYKLRALSGEAQPAPAWRDLERLVGVTNAGMFHDSGAPVGLIVSDDVERGIDNQKMGGYLAFDPRSDTDPPAIVAGRDCPGFDLADLRKRYRGIVQSYRLLGCDGSATPWSDVKRYSAAAIGVDRHGRVVFLHARAPSTMTQLSAALAHDHDLAGALFLEGGPEATLLIRGDDAELVRIGSYETGFVENDLNREFWALPNIIGLAAR